MSDELREALASIHSALPAAVGHAMCFAVEDMSGDPLLLTPSLREAADAFYETAREWQREIPNAGQGHDYG